ncbi:MAG TPA: sigma-70 family RNA polymerase sigma factor, partial [Opitutaceae bacterium]|nr:sigma-70 family RNA polymerase sigma factor [Opitutaceae bacterium]
MSDFTPDGVMMVTDMDDFDLLHRFSTEGSQDAFRQLVERHLGMVYASARRQVRSPDLAQEVAQSAFLELAREAGRLQRGRPLGPWLYVVTHRKALDVLRRESRQRQRDQIAAEVAAINQASADWVRVEPLLDQAINELAEPDRQAVILRYFEDRSLREVGGALGVSDDAAQKRISRALERLRELLGRRGIAATTAGLATEITAHAAVSVPTDLAASISSVAAAAAAGTAVTSTSAIAMTLIQKSLIATLLFGAAAGVVLYQHQTIADQERAIGTLQSQIDDLRHQAHQSARSARAVAATEAPDAGPVTAAGSLGAKLGELQKHIEDLKTRFAA